jgi:hypothetical protein
VSNSLIEEQFKFCVTSQVFHTLILLLAQLLLLDDLLHKDRNVYDNEEFKFCKVCISDIETLLFLVSCCAFWIFFMSCNKFYNVYDVQTSFSIDLVHFFVKL